MHDFAAHRRDALVAHLRKHVRGEVRFDDLTRRLYSTDASIYQVTPLGVVIPRTTDASSDGPVVVAIGDSIMEGHGLDPSDAWPALLAKQNGWRLTNLASDGSGFATVGMRATPSLTRSRSPRACIRRSC